MKFSDIAIIPLINTICGFTIVNIEDAPKVLKHNWNLDKSTGSVRTSIRHRTIRLAEFITETKGIDHIDLNKLNNLRSNFRHSTTNQNIWNRRKFKGNYTSKYKGVCWIKKLNKWLAYIRVKGRLYHLGYSHSEIEAAKMYNEAALLHFGEFANLNKI